MEEGRIELAEDAPEVDLELFLVENKGLKVVSNPSMGRVIVATRDFDEPLLHTTILREQPALVCEQQDYMDYMEQFLESPLPVQVGLLDMFFQPLDSPMGESLAEPAKLLFMLGVLEDLTVIHQLLSILMTNGHQYLQTKSAIPLFASKFAHSCHPNVGYSSANGYLEYKLLRPIKAGELVTFSYLADLLETPTNERRQLLMETKSFWCQCERCLGPDYCRCIQCPTCPNTTKNKLPCQYIQGVTEYWECDACGMLEALPLVLQERELAQTLQAIDRAIEQRQDFNTQSDYTPAALQELVHECATTLSPAHHLTVKALRLLVTVATSGAYVHMKQLIVRGLSLDQNASVYQFFRTSVVAGFQLVLAGECVAEGCAGCAGLSIMVHPPNYDRALPMRHVCDNLLQLPVHWWPPSSVTMVQRYLPILQAKFGASFVEDFAQKIVQAWQNDATCLDCGTYWDGHQQPKP